MAAEGEFPKADGDLLYASEANDFYNYPKLLLYSTSASDTFTPTKSDSIIIITATCNTYDADSGNVYTDTIDLDVDSSTVDTKSIQLATYGTPSNWARCPISLMYKTEDMATSSVPIELTSTAGVLENIKIIVMEYIKE